MWMGSENGISLQVTRCRERELVNFRISVTLCQRPSELKWPKVFASSGCGLCSHCGWTEGLKITVNRSASLTSLQLKKPITGKWGNSLKPAEWLEVFGPCVLHISSHFLDLESCFFLFSASSCLCPILALCPDPDPALQPWPKLQDLDPGLHCWGWCTFYCIDIGY